MESFKEKLLKYYSLSEEGYEEGAKAPSFSSIPLIDKDINVQKTIERLTLAKERNEKVLIYGDYDTDGIMSTSILFRALKEFGISDLHAYLPNRYEDGYGLSVKAVEKYKDEGVNLIIAVDNGISAFESLEKAIKLGIETLVIDHHEIQERIPGQPCAIIHPDVLKYGEYPVCAGYLAFLFSCALLKRADPYLLVLAATSTLSDMMPLFSYNREIVRLALKLLRKYKYKEIFSLTSKTFIDENVLQMEIIPKLNAVGRMKEGNEINVLVPYFALDSVDKSETVAFLNETNEKRKALTRIASESLSIDENSPVIVAYDPTLKEGLNGLIANRLLNLYQNKPVAVFSKKAGTDDVLVGSIRSKEGFDVMSFQREAKVEFVAFGGHALAAGCSIKEKDLSQFKKEFAFYALKHKFQGKKNPLIELRLDEINFENYKILINFGPFGQGRRAPEFVLRGLNSDEFTYFKGGAYLSWKISDEARIFSFSLNENSFEKGEIVDLVVSFTLNEFRGKFTLDLLARRLDPGEGV